MKRLAIIWRHHPWLASAFTLAAIATVFFAVRSVTFAIYWADPAHRDQPIEAWMTPRYVVHSWQLPPELMMQIIGEGPMPDKRQTLGEIADQQDISIQDLSDRIAKAAAQFRAQRE